MKRSSQKCDIQIDGNSYVFESWREINYFLTKKKLDPLFPSDRKGIVFPDIKATIHRLLVSQKASEKIPSAVQALITRVHKMSPVDH